MVAEMEQGIIPWQKPWMAAGAAISHTTGKPYSLLNQMLLGRAGEYLTYKQVQQEGGYVKRGEKAHMVVFWKWIDREDEETGEVKQIPFLRYYNVFHIDQCEGISARFAAQLPHSANADAAAEGIIADYVKREGVHMEQVEQPNDCSRSGNRFAPLQHWKRRDEDFPSSVQAHLRQELHPGGRRHGPASGHPWAFDT